MPGELTRTPTGHQSVASSLALVAMSLSFAPFTLFLTCLSWLATFVMGHRGGRTATGPTVLINGAKMYKSLGLVRALGRSGCKIILADQGAEGLLSATRFSRFVSKYVAVPPVMAGNQETSQQYVDALVKLAAQEKVDLFVPCSGAGTTVEDAQAARIMKQRNPDMRCFIPSPELTQDLHEKDRFMKLLEDLKCPRPETYMVSSPQEAIDIIRNSKNTMIMKATAVLDDVGRNDMTQYPLRGDRPPYPNTLARLKHELAVPLTADTPYIVQQYVKGSEWCTHATVVNNKLRAFACCPSSDMLMHYQNATKDRVGSISEKWTLKFLDCYAKSDRGQAEPFTGHFSMDFMLSEKDNKLYPIECNPRVHTAICLLEPNKNFASAYLDDSDSVADTVVYPRREEPTKAWLGHELAAVWLPAWLPWLSHLHPLAGHRQADPTTSANSSSSSSMMMMAPLQRLLSDPTLALDDPLPFFALYHVQWPYLLLRQVLVRRKKWSRINVSTARIFEC